MVCGEVHLCEHVEVVLDFRAVGKRKAHAREDVDYLVLYYCKRMPRAEPNGIRCACKVSVFVPVVFGLALFAQRVDAFERGLFQLVDFYSDFLFCSAGTLRKSAIRVLISPFLLRYLSLKASISSGVEALSPFTSSSSFAILSSIILKIILMRIKILMQR